MKIRLHVLGTAWTLFLAAVFAVAFTIAVPSAVAAQTPAASNGTAVPGIPPGPYPRLPEPPPVEAYLGGGRFRLLADWETASAAGDGVPLPLTADASAFWFFRPDNLELMVKVLDGCPVNQRFWVFAAGLTNVGVELTVEDTVAGVSRPYANLRGTAFAPVQDTGAFATCAEQRECGRGTTEEIAASPRADFSVEWLALMLGRRLTAPEALYQRLEGDLAAIGTLEPETEGIDFFGRWFPKTLLLEFELPIFEAIVDGSYDAWDCLNEWYGVVEVTPFIFTNPGSVALRFGHQLHPDLVGPQYAALPGALGYLRDEVSFAPIPVPPPPVLCARIDGEAIHYYFQSGSTSWHSVSPAPGQPPTAVESFDEVSLPTIPIPTIPPPWIEEFADCRYTYSAPY